ncbi:hypothetical protein LguiA_004485 [Lonicera macranthoides]
MEFTRDDKLLVEIISVDNTKGPGPIQVGIIICFKCMVMGSVTFFPFHPP